MKLSDKRHILNWGEKRRRVAARKQRGKHGLAESDVASFDAYLAGVIAAGSRVLAREHHGVPGTFTRPDDPDGLKASAAWSRVLNDIADGFQSYVDLQWVEPPPEFLRAFELFREHFSDLWD